MASRRGAFTQLDVQRAVRGARAAGVNPGEIRIAQSGEIRIFLASGEAPSETPREVLDELEGHFRNGTR